MTEQRIPVLTKCEICAAPYRDAINTKLKKGVPVATVQRWLDEAGLPSWHRNTFSTHKNEHLKDEWTREIERKSKEMDKQRKTLKPDVDLAVLVRDIVANEVANGDISPSINEGLRAQEMLDRRAEKGADRDLMLQLAQVLGGGVVMAQLPAVTIEGECTELDAERIADEAEMLQLTAGE